MPVNRLPWLQPAHVSAPVALSGFMMCPQALQAGWTGGECPWKAVYEAAWEKARRVAAPSRLERYRKHLDN